MTPTESFFREIQISLKENSWNMVDVQLCRIHILKNFNHVYDPGVLKAIISNKLSIGMLCHVPFVSASIIIL